MSSIEKPIESAIVNKIQQSLNPSYLRVINESYMHNVPKEAETHFKVVVVSDYFKDLPLIKVIYCGTIATMCNKLFWKF